MSYRLTWEPPHGVYRSFSGTVTGSDLMRSLDQIVGDQRFDELRYSISDFHDATACSATASDLETLAAVLYGAHRSNSRMISIAVSTDACAHRLVSRFVELDLSPYPVHVVPTLEAARQVIRDEG